MQKLVHVLEMKTKDWMETYRNIKVLLTVGVAHGCVHKELPGKELQGIFYYLKTKVYVSYV